ncbi:DUF6985 domain-containing protein [Ruegeria lacuscaerulensis]|uniref:DUF6985 domain-containing protein n=1 Tax=Ruegeria lacuscaerulensis TaxID=55218 RepID=UPI00147B1B0A|nr:hypothetical protein [Ruegeria lacuscaerulensis]
MTSTELEFQLEHGFFWTTKLQSDFWKQFSWLSQSGKAKGTDEKADEIHVVFAPEARDISPLNPDEIGIVEWVVASLDEISEAALSSFLRYYPVMKKNLDGYDAEEQEALMPDVTSVQELSSLINLRTICVHQITRAGVPYVGLEFDCTWDEEHGLGILMNGVRTVEIGGADVAITLWIAERDAEA